jgi:hypothetical protein
VFANEILVCFLFPLHMGLHRWYHILTTVIHEGELGGAAAAAAAGPQNLDHMNECSSGAACNFVVI